jgi:hypothetical protein
MKLTRKEAFRLSILKWEYIVENDGQDVIPGEVESLDMIGNCALCEKYLHTTDTVLRQCAECPIRPDIKDYDELGGMGCRQEVHPFQIWDYTKETAIKVLELIKSKQ